MRPLLTAALIARDEAEFLPGCLASLAGVVDEIVLVDTGSRDETPEIARSFGARLAHREWTDDFSEARNASLEMANGEWILYVDADERLVGATRQDVERLLGDTDCVAFRLLLRPFVSTTAYREYRLWRNDPRIRFQGIIHEKVVPAIHALSEAEGRPIGSADLLLVHLGYEDDQLRKHRRNLPLLRRQLEAEPDNLFAWHHLSRVLAGLGDEAGSEEALWTAVEMSRRCERPHPLAALSYADLVALQAARREDAAPLLAEARAAFPDNLVLSWLEARLLMGAGRYEEAIAPLDRILAADEETLPDRGPAYDRRLLEELPWDAKGTCLLRLGAYEEAARAYAAARRAAPDEPAYGVKESLARQRARRSPRQGAKRQEVSVATG